MNLTLSRHKFRADGIFGEVTDEAYQLVCVTLEHAYPADTVGFLPKVPAGKYTCVRGTHKLHDNIPFETFEIMGVPGHTGILFHQGNYDKDSEGCVLVGQQIGYQENKSLMIMQSRDAFKKFLDLQDGVDSFQLTIENLE
jgi:hypothetical protein